MTEPAPAPSKEAYFADFSLGWELDKALDKMGYKTPTPIQAMAIGHGLKGRDIIGQARTGTGKTAAFALPILAKISDRRPRYPKALILAPTRELASQIRDEMVKLGEYKKMRVVAVVGGRPIDEQLRRLRKGAHVVVGTPGRILDLSDRGVLSLDHVETAVLDEADEMLDMGFIDDVEEILRRVPEDRQTFLFSATTGDRVLQIAFNHMMNPKIVRIKETEEDRSNIKEIFHLVHPSERMETLRDSIAHESEGQTLIFCRTKREVDSVAERLQSAGCSVEAIHGDYRQSRRDKVMKKFKDGAINVLVATDVAARGIHVENIATVINYRLPEDPTTYVHRIGRTGRAGKSGVAITLYTMDQKYLLNDFRRRTGAGVRR
ncbi:DEAD-box ATP-dependent RNA helicase DeaD (= CshA) [hydrothermal vent metagenome]|uniref:DEAD-box ATP-dependent RNA helicase DeaD (= CshA) n=1 Tax=hydrothermal vent metagenome TaxID=652676 RepID=A0A3B1BKW2_9ZZZZ